jgi:hypothetical protein
MKLKKQMEQKQSPIEQKFDKKRSAIITCRKIWKMNYVTNLANQHSHSVSFPKLREFDDSGDREEENKNEDFIK